MCFFLPKVTININITFPTRINIIYLFFISKTKRKKLLKTRKKLEQLYIHQFSSLRDSFLLSFHFCLGFPFLPEPSSFLFFFLFITRCFPLRVLLTCSCLCCCCSCDHKTCIPPSVGICCPVRLWRRFASGGSTLEAPGAIEMVGLHE